MPAIKMNYQNGASVLAPTASQQRGGDDEDVFDAMKKKQAAAGGKQTGATYQFNKTAHKKYNSQKSLFERILKSHSEGNRFIKNEDL